MTMIYQEKFPIGTAVRIKDRECLESFQRSWNFHHAIEPKQIACAASTDVIKKVGFYHGGDVLYELQDAPGIWHEQCLERLE